MNELINLVINDTNVVTIFILSGKMSFVTLWDFSRQHFGQAHHGTGAIKRAGEIKIEKEYTGDTEQSVVEPAVEFVLEQRELDFVLFW